MEKVKKIEWAHPFLGEDERQLLLDAYDSSWISGGAYVERFEREFAAFLQVDHGVTTSNGTTALYLALLGLGVGAGDEVIVPGFGFMAAANMALAVGARPVFVDVECDTWCIDPRKVEEAITQKTKAIVALHTYGNVCDIAALQSLSKKHSVPFIEDVAEACFSTYDSHPVGTFGTISCFSFQATKTLAMGEGGYVATRDHELYERMQLIRNHGMQGAKRYWHYVPGHNFRLPNLQAAIGCGQLAKRRVICDKRKELFALYTKYLESNNEILLQVFRSPVDPVVWSMAVMLKHGDEARRDAVMQRMCAAGIETRPGFYAPSDMPLYAAQYISISEKLAHTIIALPFYVGLENDDVQLICEVLARCLQ